MGLCHEEASLTRCHPLLKWKTGQRKSPLARFAQVEGLADPPSPGVRERGGQARVSHRGGPVPLDDDAVLAAHFFAHRAAHTRLGVDEARDAAERPVVPLQAVEGADVHAEIAAGAKRFDDFGLGPVGALLNPLRPHPLRVFDALLGADVRARAAVDAQGRVDVVELLVDARDRVDGANLDAGRAPDAVRRNGMRHSEHRLLSPASRRRRGSSPYYIDSRKRASKHFPRTGVKILYA